KRHEREIRRPPMRCATASVRGCDGRRSLSPSARRCEPVIKIPEIEQILSAGAAAMNMLNAIHMLGYGGVWVTGPNTYDLHVNGLLGFEPPSRLIGFLAVGTPKTQSRIERPMREQHVEEWHG